MTAATPCPGRCNTRWRQAHEAYQAALDAYDPLDPEQARPKPPSVQPWLGDPVWCPRCTAEIRRELRRIDRVCAILRAEADGLRG